MKFCYELNDRMVCFPILYDPWWWLHYPRPQPDPWIIDKLLKPDVMENLTVLATIENLTQELSPDLREPIHNAIAKSIKRFQLPEKVSVKL